MKNILLLGSTGSIGTQTLNVIRQFPDRFKITGLAAGGNIDLLLEQIVEFAPSMVSVGSESKRKRLLDYLSERKLTCEVVCGEEGLSTIAARADYDVMVLSIAGTASLLPAYQAIKVGKDICLASKEVLVSGGVEIKRLAAENDVNLIPIDSEHAAAWQCLEAVNRDISQLDTLILTASGGPFWQLPQNQFKTISKQQALKHPNWAMGKKITIDSATLMNKGLEVIEASYLFNIPYEKIEVLIHPQSIVHAMAEFNDGNILAHLGLADMHFPIQFALTYPEKITNPWPKLKLSQIGKLEFYEPDTKKFPLLDLAYQVGKKGGNAPAILNAANEAAVNLFLGDKIAFLEIYQIVEKALAKYTFKTNYSIEDIISLDKEIKQQIANEYQY